jgi:hypothetical protein
MKHREKINPMAFWWDYTNNYLTASKIAEHYNLYEDEAQSLIELGRDQWDAASIDERQAAIDSMLEAYVGQKIFTVRGGE